MSFNSAPYNPYERNPTLQTRAHTQTDTHSFMCPIWTIDETLDTVEITYEITYSDEVSQVEVNVITKNDGYPYFEEEVRDAIIEREGKSVTINF